MIMDKHEHMSETDKLEELVMDDMEAFIRLGMKFFNCVDMMCTKDEEVAGLVFTNYPSIYKALSMIDVDVVLDSDKEAKKVKERIKELLDVLLAGAIDPMSRSYQDETKQQLIDETNILKDDIDEEL
jgi:hypothetical protein